MYETISPEQFGADELKFERARFVRCLIACLTNVVAEICVFGQLISMNDRTSLLEGRLILVAGVEGELRAFIGDAVRAAGGQTVELAKRIDEGAPFLSGRPIRPDAAIVSLQIGIRATLGLIDELIARNVRFLLLLTLGSSIPEVLLDCDVWSPPLDAGRLARGLAELLSRTRGCIWSPTMRSPDRL
jgi:hypothetical protein